MGEVADEFKKEEEAPQRLPDGRMRLPGDMSLYEISSWIGTSWEGRSATVAGLVMERMARLPKSGDTLEIEGVKVEVERVERRAIRSILVGPISRDPEEEVS